MGHSVYKPRLSPQKSNLVDLAECAGASACCADGLDECAMRSRPAASKGTRVLGGLSF
jgi:hypothetical protein